VALSQQCTKSLQYEPRYINQCLEEIITQWAVERKCSPIERRTSARHTPSSTQSSFAALAPNNLTSRTNYTMVNTTENFKYEPEHQKSHGRAQKMLRLFIGLVYLLAVSSVAPADAAGCDLFQPLDTRYPTPLPCVSKVAGASCGPHGTFAGPCNCTCACDPGYGGVFCDKTVAKGSH
jgi:hypothetical protein